MAKGGAKILLGLFFTIILAGGLAGGGAWYLTEHRAEGYRATALLLLDPAPLTVSSPTASDADPLRARIESALGVDTQRTAHAGISTADYAVLFQSDEMVNNLKVRLESIQTEKGVTGPVQTLEQVRASMKAESQVALQSASNVVYSQMVRLQYTATNPEIAAAAANAWGQLCVEQANSLAVTQTMEREGPLKSSLETARAALAAALQKQTELGSTSQLDALEIAATDGARALAELKVNIHHLEGNAARDDAALKALKAYASKAPVAVALELSVKEADAEAALAGSKAESEYTAAKLSELEASQREAQTQWAQARRVHESVNAEVDRLSADVRALEESLRSAAAGGASASVAAPAVAPTAPVGPHRYVIVAGAAVLGALAGLIVYFGLLTLRVYARALDRA
jgi:uncharacterized protein involved in exopolysaccharide biosynthesis